MCELDSFGRVANQIAAEMSNRLFVVVGSDRIRYGKDLGRIKTKTFREHVLLTQKPDLSRFRFLGTISPAQLVEIFSISDLHVYLIVSYVFSWGSLDALAC